MSLLLRINAALGAIFAVAGLIAAYACWSILENNARHEVLAEASLMLDSASAVRTYTANEIDPLLNDHMKDGFPPQSIPFYAATQNFLHLRERHPQYTYKEATLNPTNLRDRAADWEADIIQRFRNDAHAEEMVGDRDTPMGKSLYLARPIPVEAGCLACHSTPAQAPPTLIARYGSDHGFGWQAHEIVGAQVVSVPYASATANAHRAFRAFVLSLLGVFAAVFAVTNAVLFYWVVRPMRRMATVANQLSLGETPQGEFPQRGAVEILGLSASFERLRKSLEKAMRLLGA
jgi:HAMP domain-containing protein